MLLATLLVIATINCEIIPVTWNLPPKKPQLEALDGTLASKIAQLDCSAEPCSKTSSLPSRQKQTLDFNSCMQGTLSVENKDFLVQLDTGSSDTVLPGRNLNDYRSSVFLNSYSDTSALLGSTYADNSWWNGYLNWLNVTFKGTSITGSAPIMVATSQNNEAQSYSGPFMDGEFGQGLMGLGFPELAVGGDTVVNSWYRQGAISNYAIAFHGCSPDLVRNSWIDVGNDSSYQNPFPSCRSAPQFVNMPIDGSGFYNLDVQGFSVQGKSISLPTPWQDAHFSVLDSCSTMIYLPEDVFLAMQSAILDSGAFSAALANDANLTNYFDGSFENSIPIDLYSSSDILWSKLPIFSVTIYTHETPSSTVTLTLSGNQYLLFIPNEGWRFFLTSSGSDDGSYAVLGYPFFASFFIVADLSKSTVTFQPGCGCNASLPGGVGVSISSVGSNNKNRPTSSSSSQMLSSSSIMYTLLLLLHLLVVS